MNKPTVIATIITTVLIGWALWFVQQDSSSAGDAASLPIATIVGAAQSIDITAKGGYSPRVIVAKAGMPTTLRVTTNGTFDCSASLVIPKLSYQKFLQPSGTAEIAISAEQAHGTLNGTCAMGMYGFQIRFQ